ncbi:serine/threonine-protein kinase [Pseudonocardia xinjiangensis]|uniref:serine/threonine-protein kinase n=1 Tax=Pseudonocardia xinjiangensis TaxID=75289 RepID=UPI003D921C69
MISDVPEPGIPGLARPEVVGQGGYGTVYAAEEPEFGRRVAVKVLHERLDGDGVRRAFVRECQAMGALSGHPHIVTVHRSGTTARGEPYIVMDLMSAGSLADRIRRDGPLPWAEVLDVAVTVAGALETAHRAGILHLDLKPANVLVSRYGEPKLGDFGISRLPGVTETTAVGRIRASAAYASPERLLEGHATPAADLYGLGATMFALLTGRPAFVTDTEELFATVARIARDPVPDLRPAGVPDAVCRVVERLMAKAPGDRFASAAEAAEALQGAQRATGQPVTRAVVEGPAAGGPGTTATVYVPRLPPPAVPAPQFAPPPTRVPSRRGRRPLVVATVAAVLVAALATIAFLQLVDRPRSVSAAPSEPAAATGTSGAALPREHLVDVAPGVAHPALEEARTVIDGYVAGINENRYADAFALLHPDSDIARSGLEVWAKGQATTVIHNPVLTAVRDDDADGLEVDVAFTSTQSAELGPGGQTCTNWQLTYRLAGPAPGLLIRGARTIAPPQAC